MSNKYILKVGSDDFARMTMLGDIYKPNNIQFLKKMGIDHSKTIADIGCGPGNMTLFLAQAFPDAKIWAIDQSQEQLNLLEEQAKALSLKNIHCLQLDVYDLDHLKQKFDFIFSRFLLVHLTDPVLIIKKFYHLLEKSGCLVCAELDNKTWYSYPSNVYLDQDIHLLNEATKLQNSDICFGPKLYESFKKVGFLNINVEIVQPILQDKYRQYLVMRSQAFSANYVKNKLINENELPNLFSGLQKLVDDENYLLAGARMFEVFGKKP